MSDRFTIVVMSTDSYEDTWQPFFTLLNTYWPGCDHDIVLNTESKDYSFPGLNIRCAKVGYPRGKHPTWGQCMLKILSEIETSIVLYLDCDYFLSAPVDVQQIEEFAKVLASRSWARDTCVHIGLTHFGAHSPFHLTEFPLLWEVAADAPFKFSLQAGLWNRDVLAGCIHPRYSNWFFEESSHVLGRRVFGRFLTANRHVFNPEGRLIVPYTHTGIIRGKWNREAVENLFAQHNLEVDFSIRGFYSPPPPRARAPFAERVRGKINNAIHRANIAIDRIRSI